MRISIEDDAGSELGPGEVGEICISAREDGPFAGAYEPMALYWGEAEETERTLRGGKLGSAISDTSTRTVSSTSSTARRT